MIWYPGEAPQTSGVRIKMPPLFPGLSVALGKREDWVCLSVFEERQTEELKFKIYLNYGHFPILPAMVKKKKKSVYPRFPVFDDIAVRPKAPVF